MARLALIKEGTASDARTGDAHAIPMEALVEKLTPFEKRYFDAPPDVKPAKGPASSGDDYRHVVVKVDEAEINAVFPKEGYYLIPELGADDCRRLFGIGEP
jgi:hypothetical protein